MICCPNCGLQIAPHPSGLGDLPVEECITDAIRQLQLDELRAGRETPHAITIATGGLRHEQD